MHYELGKIFAPYTAIQDEDGCDVLVPEGDGTNDMWMAYVNAIVIDEETDDIPHEGCVIVYADSAPLARARAQICIDALNVSIQGGSQENTQSTTLSLVGEN